MNVGSLFSGIGGMDAGLARAGLDHAFFCEGGGDPNGSKQEREQYAQGVYRRAVLAARWPGVPIYDDVRAVGKPAGRTAADGSSAPAHVRGWEAGTGLLCGGFPCQDLSVAGKRRGLAGARSGLFHEFARIVDAFRPRWLLVENVPGLLSSNGGRDFGVVLGTLADLGYGVAWRILDSRYFGVPQRRRRVFILGTQSFDDPRAAAGRAGQVLAVGSRCPGHPPTGSQTGPDVAQSFAGRSPSRLDDAAVGGNQLIPAVAFYPTGGSHGLHDYRDGTTPPMKVGTGVGAPAGMAVSSPATGVRRLTPRECERLQGLPDDWTQIDPKTPDSKRYSGLGDAVTANVAHWIGTQFLTHDTPNPSGLEAASSTEGSEA